MGLVEQDHIGVGFGCFKENYIWFYVGCSWIENNEKDSNCQCVLE
jgi:hypothetical protein